MPICVTFQESTNLKYSYEAHKFVFTNLIGLLNKRFSFNSQVPNDSAHQNPLQEKGHQQPGSQWVQDLQREGGNGMDKDDEEGFEEEEEIEQC